MKNPFRNKMMREAYDSCMEMVMLNHPTLFNRDGSRCTENGIGSMFWRGYDGTKFGAGFIDPASKRTLAYAYYRAGKNLRKEMKND